MRLDELARRLDCELRGDGAVEITDVAPLETAGPGTITFLADRRLAGKLAGTRASAVILGRQDPEIPPPTLRAAHPYLAFVDAIELFHPAARPAAGVHPTAVVAASAVVGPEASIGAHAVVGEGVVIGRDAVLHPRVTIYPRVRIGDGFTAHAGVTIREDVTIGDRVTLHAGAVIGSDGFGYVPGAAGHRKIPQIGTVVLEDDVEVGANATIDRAALGATVVGRGAKIDNLVMVAHGCRVGPGSMLAAQTGIAGGVSLGSFVMLGGQVGVSGHLTIGDGVQVAAQSGIHDDIPAGRVYGGYPAVEVRTWRRTTASLLRLPEALRRLRRIEAKLGLRASDEPQD